MKKCFLILVLAVALAGCGKPISDAGDHDESGHGDHGAEGGGATFEEGKGLALVDETQKAIGLKMVEVATLVIDPVVSLTAQVYQSAEENLSEPVALATATVDPEAAEWIQPGEKVSFSREGESFSGIVKSVDSTQRSTIGKIEILLVLQDPKRKLAVGTFVPLFVNLPKVEATGIPRSAVLETSVGKVVYVKNGEFLLRTPVTTGIEGVNTIEVTDGLYDGDVVVSNPVESLYLIELRATKGGGHSH